MKAIALLLSIIVVVGTLAGPAFAACPYDKKNAVLLSDADFNSNHPQISNNGHIVWLAWDGTDNEIYLFDGVNVSQLTNNSIGETSPQISKNSGKVTWAAGGEIFLYDGQTVIQITNDSELDGNPQVNDAGQVVWSGDDRGPERDGEIFFYDGANIIQITDTPYSERSPKINNNGTLAWTADSNGNALFEMIVYDGATATNISGPDGHVGTFDINDNGYVVWSDSVGGYEDIFLYDGIDVKRLTDNQFFDRSPKLNNSNKVVWYREFGQLGDLEVFIYDGATVSQFTSDNHSDLLPEINDNGYVMWFKSQGKGRLYVNDGLDDHLISGHVSIQGQGARMDDNGNVVWTKVKKGISSIHFMEYCAP